MPGGASPQTSPSVPKWALPSTRSPSACLRRDLKKLKNSRCRSAGPGDGFLQTRSRHRSYFLLLCSSRRSVCFPGGGEVMLSKWAKIFGSSSTSYSSSSHYFCIARGLNTCCVCGRVPPFCLSLYLRFKSFVWSRVPFLFTQRPSDARDYLCLLQIWRFPTLRL